MGQIPTILIVDDDDVVRDSLKVLLELRQFTVRDFESARTFLAARPDTQASGCLVLDVHMPEMSGIELLRTLRNKGDQLPVILVTGRRDAAAQSQAQALGVVAFLDKPISHPALFAAIDQALKRE
jgi:two-component system response regulator FixJ